MPLFFFVQCSCWRSCCCCCYCCYHCCCCCRRCCCWGWWWHWWWCSVWWERSLQSLRWRSNHGRTLFLSQKSHLGSDFFQSITVFLDRSRSGVLSMLNWLVWSWLDLPTLRIHPGHLFVELLVQMISASSKFTAEKNALPAGWLVCVGLLVDQEEEPHQVNVQLNSLWADWETFSFSLWWYNWYMLDKDILTTYVCYM